MKDLNSVQLIGHLGADPTVIYSEVGTARTAFSVATSRQWTDADGLEQTATEWMRCTAWGKLGEIAAQYLHKGSRVYVQGRLHTFRWEDDQSGAPRASVEIILDDLILLDRPMPATTVEDEQDGGEMQPMRSTKAQQPIRRQPQPVQLRDTSAADTTSGTRPQPSRRRSHER